MDFSDKLVLVVAVLSLAVLVIGVLLVPAKPADVTSEPEENKTSPEQPEIPKTDVWSLLNKENVEDQCLEQARAFAAEQGLPGFFISGCVCSATEGPAVKSYNCTISAIDGAYLVDARCVKADERCLFTSLGGAIVYTFDEMEKLMID